MKIMPPSRHKHRQNLIHKQFLRLGGDGHHDRVGEAHFLNTGMDIPFDPWDTSRPVGSA